MAVVRETRPGLFELMIRNKLLSRALYLTFENRKVVENYGKQVDKLLDAGRGAAGSDQRRVITLSPFARSSRDMTTVVCGK